MSPSTWTYDADGNKVEAEKDERGTLIPPKKTPKRKTKAKG